MYKGRKRCSLTTTLAIYKKKTFLLEYMACLCTRNLFIIRDRPPLYTPSMFFGVSLRGHHLSTRLVLAPAACMSSRRFLRRQEEKSSLFSSDILASLFFSSCFFISSLHSSKAVASSPTVRIYPLYFLCCHLIKFCLHFFHH